MINNNEKSYLKKKFFLYKKMKNERKSYAIKYNDKFKKTCVKQLLNGNINILFYHSIE